MSFADFGVGLNAAVQGFRQGVGLAQDIKTIKKERKLEDVREQSAAEAKAAREAEISKRIKPVDYIGPDGKVAGKKYMVGDMEYDNEDDAKAYAAEDVGSAEDFFVKMAIPKQAAAYAEAGDFEKATVLNKWAEDTGVRNGLKHYAAATQAAARGDMKAATRLLKKTYNSRYADDGLDFEELTELKDKSGNIVGYQAKFKDSNTGALSTQNFNSQEDFVMFGLGTLHPQKAFEYQFEQAQAAIKARSDIAAEDRKHSKAVELEGVKARFADQQDKNQSTRRAGESKQEAINAYNAVIERGGSKKEATVAHDAVLVGGSQRQAGGQLPPKPISDDRLYFIMQEDLKANGVITDTDTPAQIEQKTWDALKQFKEKTGSLQNNSTNPAERGLGLQDSNLPPGLRRADAQPQGIRVVDKKTGEVLYR